MENSNNLLNVTDNGVNFIDQGVEESIDQRLVMALRPGSVAYRYAELNTEVLVAHIRCRTVELDRRDFCAVFYVPLMGDKRYVLSTRSKPGDTAEFSLDRLADGQLEQSVFVPIVEVADDGKKWRAFRVWSIVRLCLLDLCPHTLAERSNASLLPAVGKVVRGVTDRKLENVPVRRRVAVAFNDSDSVEELIQGAPEVVNAISRDQSPTYERRLFNDMKDDTKTSALGVTLSEEDIRLTFHPSPDLILDGISVFTRPSELEFNSTKDYVA